MTDAEVNITIEDAASRGVHVNDCEANFFLGAKEMLARDPQNECFSAS